LNAAKDGFQKQRAVSTCFLDTLINRSCQLNVQAKKRVPASLRAFEGLFFAASWRKNGSDDGERTLSTWCDEFLDMNCV
jgi:hypothetical protein